MATVSKSALLENRLGPRPYTIEGVGEVMIRPLKQAEAQTVQRIENLRERDHAIIYLGMCEPAMTLEDVGQWSENAPAGELVKLGMEIARISGMLDGQAKETTKSTPRRRG